MAISYAKSKLITKKLQVGEMKVTPLLYNKFIKIRKLKFKANISMTFYALSKVKGVN
jgi:hypothetical protein